MKLLIAIQASLATAAVLADRKRLEWYQNHYTRAIYKFRDDYTLQVVDHSTYIGTRLSDLVLWMGQMGNEQNISQMTFCTTSYTIVERMLYEAGYHPREARDCWQLRTARLRGFSATFNIEPFFNPDRYQEQHSIRSQINSFNALPQLTRKIRYYA